MSIPLYKPLVSKEERSAVSKVLKSRILSRGTEVDKFEREFAKFVGKKYAVAVNSGTSALQMLIRALGWKAGDEVITTPFSYVASANALLLEGVKPIFVDIDPDTLNIDPVKIEKNITKNTKGILLVHIFGLPADVAKIRLIAQKHSLDVIEDACEAIGRPSKRFPVSAIGVGSVYGFHENKQMTTLGEGGMIVTDDYKIATACASLRDQGRAKGKDWIKNVILGFNLRMTEAQAAFGSAQLKKIDLILKKRSMLAEHYQTKLLGIDHLELPFSVKGSLRSWFLFYVRFDDFRFKIKVCEALKKAGIGFSTNYFPPIYRFPAHSAFVKHDHVHTEQAYESILVLPLFTEMTKGQVDIVVSTIRKCLTI
jgi:perosamine synthetase